MNRGPGCQRPVAPRDAMGGRAPTARYTTAAMQCRSPAKAGPRLPGGGSDEEAVYTQACTPAGRSGAVGSQGPVFQQHSASQSVTCQLAGRHSRGLAARGWGTDGFCDSEEQGCELETVGGAEKEQRGAGGGLADLFADRHRAHAGHGGLARGLAVSWPDTGFHRAPRRRRAVCSCGPVLESLSSSE